MSSAMELRAEMVERQSSNSEANDMRDRKRRQSTAYQHDAMRERGISGAALDEEEAPAATDVEGESATPEDSLDAIDGKRTKTFMDPAKKQIITDVVDAQIVDQAYAQVRAPRSYAAVVGLTAAAAAARLRQRQLTRSRAAVAPEPPV